MLDVRWAAPDVTMHSPAGLQSAQGNTQALKGVSGALQGIGEQHGPGHKCRVDEDAQLGEHMTALLWHPCFSVSDSRVVSCIIGMSFMRT